MRPIFEHARVAVPEIGFGLVVGLFATPLAIVIGRRLRLLDLPTGIKIHSQPVPFTGGLALVLVLLVAATVWPIPRALLAGACLFWAIGLADDIRRFNPWTKLLLQVGALVTVVLVLDDGVPGGVMGGIAAVAIGLVFINAFNVLDGLNGLAAGVGFFTLLPAGLSERPCHEVAALTAGFAIAFLIFNLAGSQIFLGDQGSLALGFVLLFMSLCIPRGEPRVSGVISTALIWLVPSINAAFVIVRRLSEHRPILVGDRAHLYDVLHRRFGLKQTLAIAWVSAAVAGLGAVISNLPRD